MKVNRIVICSGYKAKLISTIVDWKALFSLVSVAIK